LKQALKAKCSTSGSTGRREKAPSAGVPYGVPRTSELNFMTTANRKTKRKRTAAEKAAKKRRRLEYMYVFMNGKQKRIKRPPTVDGMDPDEFIRQNPTRYCCIKTSCGNTSMTHRMMINGIGSYSQKSGEHFTDEI
jgi:hypothetical protein